MRVVGCTLVSNAVQLDFPIVAAIRSILPLCEEVVVNVGPSRDATMDLVRTVADPRVRIIEGVWDHALGSGMLAAETQRAMEAAPADWVVYIQADEVLHEDGVPLIRSALRASHADRRVEGLLVDYLHFYGSFDRIATNRQWYRREVRVVRMGAGVRSFRDAQGFRVGPEARRIRARPTGARMFHYCLARKAEALLAKRAIDAHIYHGGLPTGGPSAAPVIPWVYGLKPYAGTHPAAAREWIAEHAQAHREVGPPQHLRDTKFIISDWIERLTGWLPFPYRNYVEV